MTLEKYLEIYSWARDLEQEALQVIRTHEGAVTARVFHLNDTLRQLSNLTFTQADSLKQAARCIEVGVYRASFVMAWAAVADLILDLSTTRKELILDQRKNWSFKDKTDLAEKYTEHSIIEAIRDAGLVSKGEMKTLHGMLHKRNQCAHPTGYYPGANEALGFLDECLAKSTLLASAI